MNEITKKKNVAFWKIVGCIDSCVDELQLLSCEKMIDNFYRLFEGKVNRDTLFEERRSLRIASITKSIKFNPELVLELDYTLI